MIQQIEDAIVALVKAASNAGVLGYQFETAAAYGLAADQIDRGVLAYPAMWAIYAGDRTAPEDAGGHQMRYSPTFMVFVAAEDWQSKTFTREKGDSLAPGAYQLMQDVRRLLVGHNLGMPIQRLRPGRTTVVPVEQNVSVISIEFETSYVEEIDPEIDGVHDFLRFRADYDVPPHGNVVPPLPAQQADARDAVDLPGPAAT